MGVYISVVCVCVCVCVCSVTESCLSLCDPMKYNLPGPSVHGILQARILIRKVCHFLLQGILPTQGSNPHLLHLLHCLADSSPLSHLESPYTAVRKFVFQIIRKLLVL